MKLVIQKVRNTKIEVESQTVGTIETWLLVLVGIQQNDTLEDVKKCHDVLVTGKYFPSDDGHFSKTVGDVNAWILVVSQFTLLGVFRPSGARRFEQAAKPAEAQDLYKQFILLLNQSHPGKIQTGTFGAYMLVTSTNDGPVTLEYDSTL